jgi:hypothetical protein
MRGIAVLFVALAGMLTGCAGPSNPQAGPLPAVDAASVQVRNSNWMDMTVYVESGTVRVRLGTVTSMGVSRFDIPGSLLTGPGEIQFIADPIGLPSGFRSHELNVWPGQTIRFNIENQLTLSNVSIGA